MATRMTLDEISKKINVSRTTIYKVLNNKGFVSEKTTQKVRRSLEEYNYVPNYNARDLAKSKRYRIAYIGMRHLSAKYFSSLINKGLARAHTDFVDHGLEILIEESDFENPQKQIRDIDKMRERGITNFIISPSDVFLLKDKIDELQKQKCNVILLSRYVDLPVKTYVGVNYYKSGMLAGEMLTKIMPSGGRIVIITNSSAKDDNTVRERYLGFMSWIEKFKQYEIVEVIESVNTDELALQTFDYMTEKYNDLNEIDAIYDITYKLNIFAEKVHLLGKDQDIKLVGFDIYKENAEYVGKAVIDIVIGQQLSEQAYDAARMLFQKVCHGIDYAKKDYYSRLDVIVASNLDYFI